MKNHPYEWKFVTSTAFQHFFLTLFQYLSVQIIPSSILKYNLTNGKKISLFEILIKFHRKFRHKFRKKLESLAPIILKS